MPIVLLLQPYTDCYSNLSLPFEPDTRFFAIELHNVAVKVS